MINLPIKLNMEKKEIAFRQIKAAAKHYKSGEYICCITLAGAAEEILGKIAKKRSGFNQLGKDIIYAQSIYQYFSKTIPPKNDIIQNINKIKNELKHNDTGENLWVEANFEDEATSLFVKAVKNYFDSFGELPKDRTVIKLFDFLTL